MASLPNEIDPAGFTMTSEDREKRLTIKTSPSTGTGLKLEYDLLSTPKTFDLTPNGVNWTDGTNNYTTALERLALVQQAFQSVELPPNATTLAINSNVQVSDGITTNTLTKDHWSGQIQTVNTIANSTHYLNFSDSSATGYGKPQKTAGISCNPSTNTLTVDTINAPTTTNLTLESQSTRDVILKTNGVNRVTVSSSGIANFSTLPECSVIPTTINQLVNKSYVDSYPTLSNVLTNGNSASKLINMNSNNITNNNSISFLNQDGERKLVFRDTSDLNYFPYTTYTATDYETKISKDAQSTKININSQSDISLNEIPPNTQTITGLTSNVNNLVTTITPTLTNTACYSVFPDISKTIYCTDVTTKVLYIQDYIGSGIQSIDLSSVTAGSGNYSSRVSSLGIQQIVPVYYNSATDCKFYLRMGENSANNNFYVLTCDGNPLLTSSYTYGINYLIVTTAPSLVVSTNGSPATFTSVTNGMSINVNRINITYHDNINNYFILGTQSSSLVNNYYIVLSVDTLQYAAYAVPIPSGYTNSAFNQYNSTYNQNSWFKLYNNATGSSTGILQLVNWNPITKTMTRAPDFNIGTATTGDFPNFGNIDGYTFSASDSLLIACIPYADNLVSGANLYLAYFTWDKSTANSPVLVRNVLLENSATQTYYTISYVSVRMYNQNVIEVVSSASDTAYVSNNAFSTFTTYTSIGLRSTYTTFTNGEGDGLSQSRFSIVLPEHYYFRGNVTANYNNFCLYSLRTSGNSTPINYLNFGYNTTTSSGTVSSSRDMTFSANPLKFSGAVQYPTIPSVSSGYDKLVFKLSDNSFGKQTNYYSYIWKNSDQSIGTGVQQIINWGGSTNFTGTGITFSSGDDEFTFNTIGKFMINYTITVSPTTTDGNVFMFLKTGSTVLPGSVFTQYCTSGTNTLIIGTYIMASNTTTAKLALYASSSVGFTVNNIPTSGNVPPATTTCASVMISQID